MIEIAAHLGVPLADTIALGDSHNDLEMIQCAGVGVAMGNARAELQEAADFVTSDVDHDGFAEALTRLGVI